MKTDRIIGWVSIMMMFMFFSVLWVLVHEYVSDPVMVVISEVSVALCWAVVLWSGFMAWFTWVLD